MTVQETDIHTVDKEISKGGEEGDKGEQEGAKGVQKGADTDIQTGGEREKGERMKMTQCEDSLRPGNPSRLKEKVDSRRAWEKLNFKQPLSKTIKKKGKSKN